MRTTATTQTSAALPWAINVWGQLFAVAVVVVVVFAVAAVASISNHKTEGGGQNERADEEGAKSEFALCLLEFHISPSVSFAGINARESARERSAKICERQKTNSGCM